MRYFTIAALLCILSSCKSEDDRVQEIIDKSYYGFASTLRMGEVDKLDEDLLVFPVFDSLLNQHCTVLDGHEYRIVRYIYKTERGVARMFYIVDLTIGGVAKKSNDYEDFFGPLMEEMTDVGPEFDLKGDRTAWLMSQ